MQSEENKQSKMIHGKGRGGEWRGEGKEEGERKEGREVGGGAVHKERCKIAAFIIVRLNSVSFCMPFFL